MTGAKIKSTGSRARKCCGVLPVSAGGSLSVAQFSQERVSKAKAPSFAFSGASLLNASTVRGDASFEIHFNKEVRRTLWACRSYFEYAGELVQLPAGAKVYLFAPKVAGMIRCVRLRLDGRSWWNRQDFLALDASFSRAVNKLTTVSGAPQFLSGRTKRKRRRNHRGKGSLARRKEARKTAISKLSDMAKRNQTATQEAAAALLEQQSVKLTQETVKVAGELLADVIAFKGPYFDEVISETRLPGQHLAAVAAREDLVSFVESNFQKPFPISKFFISSKHELVVARDKPPVPLFLGLDHQSRLVVYYSVSGVQKVTPVVTPRNADYWRCNMRGKEMFCCQREHLTPKLFGFKVRAGNNT